MATKKYKKMYVYVLPKQYKEIEKEAKARKKSMSFVLREIIEQSDEAYNILYAGMNTDKYRITNSLGVKSITVSASNIEDVLKQMKRNFIEANERNTDK